MSNNSTTNSTSNPATTRSQISPLHQFNTPSPITPKPHNFRVYPAIHHFQPVIELNIEEHPYFFTKNRPRSPTFQHPKIQKIISISSANLTNPGKISILVFYHIFIKIIQANRECIYGKYKITIKHEGEPI